MKNWDDEMVQRLSKAYDDVENFENKFTAEWLFLINQTESDIPVVNQEHYEKAVDYLVIKKGFGHQLRDWSHFVLNHDSLTDKYKKTKEIYYLDPEEIDHCVTMARE